MQKFWDVHNFMFRLRWAIILCHVWFLVDKEGNVCISILHDPGDDRWGYEKPEERWLPVHTVETILLSVISMLADPNHDSPANVDAAVRFIFVIFCSEIPLWCWVKTYNACWDEKRCLFYQFVVKIIIVTFHFLVVWHCTCGDCRQSCQRMAATSNSPTWTADECFRFF